MSSPAQSEMDVDVFLAWAAGREGRWELRDGQPVHDGAGARASCPYQSTRRKRRLKAAIRMRRATMPHVSRWDDGEDHQPARLSSRTPSSSARRPADLNTMEIPNPIIVVEVLSPSTAADDHGVKLDGYFSLPSVAHYLILDADRRVMIWHRRGGAGAIETRVVRDGVIRLDPPGFEAEAAAFFAIE